MGCLQSRRSYEKVGEETASEYFAGKLIVHVGSADDLHNADFNGASDPYVQILVDGKLVGKTKTIADELSPEWNEDVIVDLHGNYKHLILQVCDEDFTASDDLGLFQLEFAKISQSAKLNADHLLSYESMPLTHRKQGRKGGHLTFSVQLVYPGWEVFRCPMPLRKKCKVLLYQSAHVDETDDLKPIYQQDPDADPHVPGRCYEDIYNTIINAKKFVYITGWSVQPTIRLLRRPRIGEKELGDVPTLGEMLIKKAEEGVSVLVHVWDELTSVDLSVTKFSGVISTGDEAVLSYFKGTKVIAKKSYRMGNKVGSVLMFSHHQKTVMADETVIVDDKERSRIVAYVGGLDLTGGRWDTPRKSLFRSLQKEHKEDFYTTWPSVCAADGPRQPWQDIHCKLYGPIARDVLKNFEQRWEKQANTMLKNLANIKDDNMFLTLKEEKALLSDTNEDLYNCQLWRSIDETSATVPGIEKTIEEGYVTAIRAAKRFIYIETQYFLGSSQHWIGGDKSQAGKHRIPIEIARRVVRSIETGEDFKVYLLVPLYPEGLPSDVAIKEILYWQWCTFQMMYDIIAKALMKAESVKTPEDYLTIYCLGNREKPTDDSTVALESDLDYVKNVHKSRRFQVYVHSKMMIIDDEFISVGSANINQRSMGGNRY